MKENPEEDTVQRVVCSGRSSTLVAIAVQLSPISAPNQITQTLHGRRVNHRLSPNQPNPLENQKTSSSSPKSHFLAVNFLTLPLGVLPAAGVLDSKLNPWSLNPMFSTSLASIAELLGVRFLFLVGERHCSSRSIASSLRRRDSFSDSRSEMRSEALGMGSSWTMGC